MNIPKNTKEPYDFFKLIFDDEYLNIFVHNSNEYKTSKKNKIELESSKTNNAYINKLNDLKGKTTRIERQKIEKNIAVELLSGFVNLSSYKDYWSTDLLLINSISSIITESMFCSINE